MQHKPLHRWGNFADEVGITSLAHCDAAGSRPHMPLAVGPARIVIRHLGWVSDETQSTMPGSDNLMLATFARTWASQAQ
jgi:hypothetical protein